MKMNLFYQLILFYMKQMLKNYFYVGSMLFMIMMLLLRFYFRATEFYKYADYGSLVGEMTMIVQAMMLLVMIYFYKLLSDEFRFGANRSIVSSLRVTLLKIAAILCNHLLFLGALIGIQFIFIAVFFQMSGISFSFFYLETASYLIVYWYLPLVFAALIGMAIALLFGKNKLSFVFMILIWLTLGPVNTELFSFYFRSIPFSDIRSLLYIGPLNSAIPYYELIGYNVSRSTYLKILFWIFVTMSIVLIILLKSARTSRERGILVSGFCFLILVNILLFPNIFQDGKLSFSFGDEKIESLYYKDHEDVVDERHLQYTIERYDIRLDAKKDVYAQVDVTLREIGNSTLVFVLYHYFDVSKIISSTGEEVPFHQKRDFIYVDGMKKTSEQLTFYYKMNNSVKLPVSNKYLYLPNYFSWLPTKSAQPPIEYFGLYGADQTFYNSMQSKKPISYTLTFDGKASLYTNLTANEDGTYSGDVIGGISVFAGQFIKKQYRGYEVIYPNSWAKLNKDWRIFEKYLVESHQEIEAIFEVEDKPLPKQIVLLKPVFDWRETSYFSSDHLLYQDSTSLNISWAVKHIPRILLEGMLWNDDERASQSYEQIYAFNEIARYFIRDKIGIESQVHELAVAEPNLTIFYNHSQEIQKALTYFYDEFYLLSLNEQEAFLQLWYKEMHNVSDSWLKTVKLLEQFKEDLP